MYILSYICLVAKLVLVFYYLCCISIQDIGIKRRKKIKDKTDDKLFPVFKNELLFCHLHG
jgi:hypothetical protein